MVIIIPPLPAKAKDEFAQSWSDHESKSPLCCRLLRIVIWFGAVKYEIGRRRVVAIVYGYYTFMAPSSVQKSAAQRARWTTNNPPVTIKRSRLEYFPNQLWTALFGSVNTIPEECRAIKKLYGILFKSVYDRPRRAISPTKRGRVISRHSPRLRYTHNARWPQEVAQEQGQGNPIRPFLFNPALFRFRLA